MKAALKKHGGIPSSPAKGDSDSSSDQIRACLQASIRAHQDLLAADLVHTLAQVGRVITESLRHGGKLLVFGNGGSAADAQHFAAELVGKYHRRRPALPALALTVNSSSLTAIGNDYSFDEVFSRQIEAYGSPGDVAVGISTSGNSANVLEGLKAAKQRGLVTVGLTGKGGEKLKPMADFCLCVPSSDTPRIQEGHLLMEHILSEFVEGELFPAPEI